MSAAPVRASARTWLIALLCGTLAATSVYFFALHDWHEAWRRYSTLEWWYLSWNAETFYWKHWWLVLLIMAVYFIIGFHQARGEPVASGWKGLFWIAAGLLCHWEAVRAGFVRLSVLSLPMLILGGVHFVAGWQRARHLVFPLSLGLLLVPFPGVHHLTNYVSQPANKLAEQLVWLLGGRDDYRSHGWMGLCSSVNFSFLIPVILTSVVMARCCHRSVWGRLFVVGLALPVAFATEVLRAAVNERLREMDHGLYHLPLYDVWELLLVLLFSGICFFLACRLTGGMRRANPTKSAPPAPLPPQL